MHIFGYGCPLENTFSLCITYSYYCAQKQQRIKNNTSTTLSLTTGIDFNKVKIKNDETNFVEAGELFTRQLEADGGSPPYLWELVQDYEEEHFEQAFPEAAGAVLSSTSLVNHKVGNLVANTKDFSNIIAKIEGQ